MEILHCSDVLLAVNKPPGLSSIPGGWETGAPSLFELLQKDYGDLWIVHRLDRGTSGVILFARTAAAHRTLSLLFETRAIRKIYHAIVVGNPRWDEHTARHPLRFDVGHRHRTVVDHGKGKPSETAFRVLERLNGFSLLEAHPGTGRTHQVRVHAYALGFPLLADDLYGDARPGVGQDMALPYPALHAYSLEFGFEGESFSFTAPYSEDFRRVLAKLKKRR